DVQEGEHQPQGGVQQADAAPLAADRLPAPDHPGHRLSDPFVPSAGARLPGPGCGADPAVDRRAATGDLPPGGHDAPADGCAPGVVDRLHLRQHRLRDRRARPDAPVGIGRVPALAAAAGGGPELRPVGHRVLRHPAPEAPGRPDLRRFGAGGAADGRRARPGLHHHPDAHAHPDRLEPDRTACAVGRSGRAPAPIRLRAGRQPQRPRPGERRRAGRGHPRRRGAQLRGHPGHHRRLRGGGRAHRPGPDDRGGPPAGPDRPGLAPAAVLFAPGGQPMRRASPLLVSAATLAVTGCALGPDYKPPVPPAGATAPLVSVDPAVETVAEPPDAWWRLYDDALLDRLVTQAFAANRDLAAAEANLSAARAALEGARNGQYPQTNINLGAKYGRDASTDEILEIDGHKPETIWVFDDILDVSYELDLFGRVRRSIEASHADADASVASRDAVRITVAAETTRAYAQVCALGEELAVARRSLEVTGREAEIARQRVTLGAGTDFDVVRAEQIQAQASAAIPPLEGQRRAALFQLTALLGRTPSQAATEAE